MILELGLSGKAAACLKIIISSGLVAASWAPQCDDAHEHLHGQRQGSVVKMSSPLKILWT